MMSIQDFKDMDYGWNRYDGMYTNSTNICIDIYTYVYLYSDYIYTSIFYIQLKAKLRVCCHII